MRLLRLPVRCPDCKRPIRFRINESERDTHANDRPDRVLATVQCHACDAIYPIKAGDYQMAS